MESEAVKLRGTWYIAVVAIMLLQSAALMAHDTGLVYARLERPSSGGKVMLQATVECLSNPMVPTQEAAREALVTLFDLQNASSENGGVAGAGRTTRGKLLGVPAWSVQAEWTDNSVPVSVQGPEDDAEEHCWVTARWELELLTDEAVCLHVNADTKLGALLWEVPPSGQSPDPDGRTRWQILLPGDRSPRLNVPQETPKSENVTEPVSAPAPVLVHRMGRGWSVVVLGSLMVTALAFGRLHQRRYDFRAFFRPDRKSCADIA
ncbi:hypothetical protein [Roseimicrobium sp. ORNL1]|uniref:hypothetical protein n=1 Tax=Roseimicrobium sp. ORNL1 TaxID=2711231 RepID=UPI00198133EF|nr:hypothetical protein [Roseimicrobium sp. ORNL1]